MNGQGGVLDLRGSFCMASIFFIFYFEIVACLGVFRVLACVRCVEV